jgi:hypothetical protein
MKTFDISPSWRTSTVIALCQGMREAQDFSSLPILADALQDADCNDAKLLETLREHGESLSWSATVALVAVVMDPDAAYWVRQVTEIAEALGAPEYYGSAEDGSDDSHDDPLTYETLMDGARAYAESQERGDFGDYIHMGTNEAYKGGFPAKEFWACYQKLTGRAVADDDASFFSCSC